MRKCAWLGVVLAVASTCGLRPAAQVPGLSHGPAPLTAKPLPAEDAAIRAVLEKQAADWNRGDLDAFATGYKNSPDILFLGKTVRRGYAQMLAGYKAGYPTAKRMGRLTFSMLEVQPLDSQFATVTGKFALARAAADGGPASGSFLLVVEKTHAGWKIVRDDTRDDTVEAAPAK